MRRLELTGLAALCLTVVVQAQQKPRPQYAMDYGPFLSATVECPWPEDNIALKGLAIRLGDAGGVLFDTELLRVAGAWTGGFLTLTGTPFDGAHGPIPRVRGRQVFGTAVQPGWAQAGSFADPRSIPHGPLSRDHARYRGVYRHGDDVVVSYSVGQTGVLESFAVEGAGDMLAIARTLNFATMPQPTRLALCSRPGSQVEVSRSGRTARVTHRQPEAGLVRMDRSGGAWSDLAMGGPSAADYADQSGNRGVRMQWVFRRDAKDKKRKPESRARMLEQAGKRLPKLTDGVGQEHDSDRNASVWIDGSGGRLLMDLQRSVQVTGIGTYSWELRGRSIQRYTVYGSAAAAAPDAHAEDLVTAGWTQIADVDTHALGDGDKHGVHIAKPDSSPLGEFRHLLFETRRHRTLMGEIDIFTVDAPAPARPTRPMGTLIHVADLPAGAELEAGEDGMVVLSIPAGEARRCKVLYWDGPLARMGEFRSLARASSPAVDLGKRTRGGPSRWTEVVKTAGTLGDGKGAYVVDTLTVPYENPWNSRMRIGGLDFFSDGRAALSTWNGDVWIVSGIDGDLDELTWKRHASGLFDPLGLKIVDDVVYTLGRDQITRLHDVDGDGEADWYECFNNDVLITKNFHEFAFDLQTDSAGNFYFSKGGPVRPGGRGFDKLVPHHGCILKVSPDGSSLEVYATGLRAPNGIGVGPDGRVTSGDNEGTWMPRCRLNWIGPGTFCGCVDTAQRASPPTNYDLPVCWMPMEVDNSSGGQVWVTSDRWGDFQGDLLHLSYGTCSLYKVLLQEIDGVVQGGVTRFPLSFASSCMRARFHPGDGQLYVAGLRGWQTSAAKLSAFHRVRYTGKSAYMARELEVREGGIRITFTDALDPETATDPESYTLAQWNYLWSDRYGSPEISTDETKAAADRKAASSDWNKYKNHDEVAVKAARLLDDGRTVFLEIEGLKPVMQMRIRYNLDAADGELVKGEIYNSIHRVPGDRSKGDRD